MNNHLKWNAAAYNPQQYKNFAGALYAFFQQELPQLAGDLSRRALVRGIVEMVDRFYPSTTHLRPGQIHWTAISKNEKPSYGKKINQCRMEHVILDLVRAQDIAERAGGKRLREIKKEAVARLYQQAYAQGGCLTAAEVAILLKIALHTASRYARQWEEEHGALLPRRGTVHDMGRSLTHKKEIVKKLLIERKSVEEVCRETHHSPEAVHRYITACRQVLLCRRKGLTTQETAYAVGHKPQLVKEYEKLITEMGNVTEVLRDLTDLEKEVLR
jgi:DNA-binding CsgD family transcriptional regulator